MAHVLTTRWVHDANTGGGAAATNGGGFDAYMGADQTTFTGADADNSITCDLAGTTITSGSSCTHFASGMVGSILVITGGPGFVPGWYRVASYVSEHVITVALTPCVLVAGTGGIGFVSAGIAYNWPGAALYPGPQLTFASAAHNLLAAGSGAVVTAEHADETFTAAHVGNTLYISGGTNLTAGWYQVLSVAGGAATLDRTCASGACTDGTGFLGGALCILNGTTLTNHWANANCIVAGQAIYFKAGTYTMTTANVTAGTAGTTTSPVDIIGFNASPGDLSAPRPANYTDVPILNFAAYFPTLAVYWNVTAVRFISTATIGFNHSASSYAVMRRCGFLNVKTTAANAATGQLGDRFDACWFSSPCGGMAFNAADATCGLFNCLIHSTSGATTAGALVVGAANCSIVNTIIATGNAGVYLNASNRCDLIGCTIYNLITGLGSTNTAQAGAIIRNNIIAYCTSGIVVATAQYGAAHSDYDNFFGNGTDVTLWPKGPSDSAYDPAFQGHIQYALSCSHSTRTVLTGGSDFNARFQAYNGTDPFKRRVIRLVSATGTGFVAGVYVVASVDSDTQLTVTTNVADASHDLTAILAYDCGDFRLGTASPCLTAGEGIGMAVG